MTMLPAQEGSEGRPPGPLPRLAGLAAVAADYDVLLCDIWGVVHDGVNAFALAAEALRRFRVGRGADGRPRRVVLITNAPRSRDSVARQLARLGVPEGTHDAIISSGDLTRALVAERAGLPVHHLGPPRDLSVFGDEGERASVRFVAADEAAYVVCTGLFDDDRETAEDYRDALARMRARDLVMICANPDLVVERGDRIVPCAGSIAVAYEALGGTVIYAGKPHRPIYEAALGLAGFEGGVPLARVLAIGDALRTDIAGARGLGCRSLLVARGIHHAEIAAAGLLGRGDEGDDAGRAERAEAWLAGRPRPDFLAEALAWEE